MFNCFKTNMNKTYGATMFASASACSACENTALLLTKDTALAVSIFVCEIIISIISLIAGIIIIIGEKFMKRPKTVPIL